MRMPNWTERLEPSDLVESQKKWLASLSRDCKMRDCGKVMKIANVNEAAESHNMKWPYYECKGPHGFTQSGNQWETYRQML